MWWYKIIFFPVKCVKREAQVMESLSHPNIVKMYEAFQSEDKKTIQFVIEYVAPPEDCTDL